jgi:hemin uptake protein HemP
MLPRAVSTGLARIKSEPPPAKRISSDVLLGEARELVILHNGREYRLRQTQSGKLILTA